MSEPTTPPLTAQCPERCLGVVGHAGPHQTSDGRPLLFAHDVERLARALHDTDGEKHPVGLGGYTPEACAFHILWAESILAAYQEVGE